MKLFSPLLKMTELDEDSLTETASFITAQEENNITLSSLFYQNGECQIPSPASYKIFLFREPSSRMLKGVLALSKTGSILHCLKFTTEKEESLFKKMISNEIPQDWIFCIIGEKKGTDLVASAIKRKSQERRSYTLMHFECKAPKLPLPEGLKLIQCGTEQLEALCPLQKGYEIDEVLLAPEDFEETASRLTLRKFLREQIIYALFTQGSTKASIPVAKAGTNARGLNWCQLGGIYTVPRYRNKGYAAFLAQSLALKIAQSGKKTALFVKDKNIAAQKAYTKAGFVKDKAFEIIYY